jgi:hypothetical protein
LSISFKPLIFIMRRPVRLLKHKNPVPPGGARPIHLHFQTGAITNGAAEPYPFNKTGRFQRKGAKTQGHSAAKILSKKQNFPGEQCKEDIAHASPTHHTVSFDQRVNFAS